MYNDVQSWFICLTFFQDKKLANLYFCFQRCIEKGRRMEKLYFKKNIFTLYLKLLINIENANQSCKLFDTMQQLKLIVNSPCYNVYLQLFVTLQEVQDVTRET